MDFGAEPIFPVLCLPELELNFQTFSDPHANDPEIYLTDFQDITENVSVAVDNHPGQIATEQIFEQLQVVDVVKPEPEQENSTSRGIPAEVIRQIILPSVSQDHNTGQYQAIDHWQSFGSQSTAWPKLENEGMLWQNFFPVEENSPFQNNSRQIFEDPRDGTIIEIIEFEDSAVSGSDNIQFEVVPTSESSQHQPFNTSSPICPNATLFNEEKEGKRRPRASYTVQQVTSISLVLIEKHNGGRQP
jgi:hypothetical protein